MSIQTSFVMSIQTSFVMKPDVDLVRKITILLWGVDYSRPKEYCNMLWRNTIEGAAYWKEVRKNLLDIYEEFRTDDY